MKKQRFYIDAEGNDDKAYREAMQFACELADKDEEIKRVVLLIASKQNNGWFEREFDSDTVKQLFKGIKFKGCKPTFKFETLLTYRPGYSPSEVLVACGLNTEGIQQIDDSRSARAIIAIPWLKEDLQKWVQAWNPTEIRSNQQAGTKVTEPSCVVKKAMEALTHMVNMTTGINHPMDNKIAKTYILALHKYEPSLDTDLVGAYLMREMGWSSKHAQDIEKLITTLNNGKSFQGGERTGLQHHYKRWKTDCNG